MDTLLVQRFEVQIHHRISGQVGGEVPHVSPWPCPFIVVEYNLSLKNPPTLTPTTKQNTTQAWCRGSQWIAKLSILYLEMFLCRVVVCFCEGRTVRGLLAAIRANQLEGLFHIMGRLVAADTCHVASLWHVSIDLVMTRVTWPRLVTIFFSFCSFLPLLLLRSFIISVTNVIQI